MREWLQARFIRFIVKDVFHALTKDDFLVIKGDKWEWKGKELSPEMVGTLKAQASEFQKSTLWKVLKSEIQWVTVKTLLEKGKSSTDLRIAQITGYLTTVIDQKLQEMKWYVDNYQCENSMVK